MLKIAVIIGSTRVTRFADKPAEWLKTIVAGRTDASYEFIDSRNVRFKPPALAGQLSARY